MMLILETLLLPAPEGPVERLFQDLLDEQTRHGLDPCGTILGGVTLPTRSRFAELQSVAFAAGEAVEAALDPTNRDCLYRLAALSLSPLTASVAVGDRSSVSAPSDPPFPLPTLIGSERPATVAFGRRQQAIWARAAGRPRAEEFEAEALLRSAISAAKGGRRSDR